MTASTFPTVTQSISYSTGPLATPSYTDVSAYLRHLSTNRGRSFEYDRIEAGTSTHILDNRDSRFNPDNASGPYYPNVLPNRRVKTTATWSTVTYGLFAGFAMGYPQTYAHGGYDSFIQQNATDWWFAFNQIKFPPGTTFSAETTGTRIGHCLDLVGVAAGDRSIATGHSTVAAVGELVAATATLTNDGYFCNNGEKAQLDTTVYEFVTSLTGAAYQVLIGADGPTCLLNLKAAVNAEQGVGVTYGTGTVANATVTCTAASANTLTFTAVAAGAGGNILASLTSAEGHNSFPDVMFTGGTTNTPLDGTTILEHMLLMADTENSRFFVDRDGVITFIDRHTQLKSELTSRGTFGDGGGSEYAYAADPAPSVTQDETRLVNTVRITSGDGTVLSATDATSIANYFERTYEKTLPFASNNEAQDCADYTLSRLKDPQTRISELTVKPVASAAVMWPVMLGVEIGQRYTFKLRPKGGGSTITHDVVVDGVSHEVAPKNWNVKLRLVPADTRTYWQLGVVGYGEIDVATVLAF